MPEVLRRNAVPVLAVGIVLAALTAWHAGGSYGIRLLTVAGIYALLATGYQLVFGFAGALSLAQGAFFGVGAYATGILATRYGVDGVLTLAVSILLPTLLAAVVAAPVLRLESHYFALATLGLAQLALLVATNAETLTGGANGIPGVPGLVLLGVAVPRGWPMLVAVWIAVGFGAWLAWRWTAGRQALVFRLLRDDPTAAETLGIDTGRLRFNAFLFAAACAGFAGALHVHLIGVVSPEVLEFPIMVACLSMVVIGGRARISGAILGAVLLVHLPELLREIGAWYMVVYGAVLLAVITFAPDGIVGVLSRWKPPTPTLPHVRATPKASSRLGKGGRRQASFPTPSHLVEMRGITKRFGGVTALDHVDLAIDAGDMLGIIGPNGSGKTTLINVLSGLYRPDAGAVLLGGDRIDALPPFRIARAGVARGFQAPRLIDDISVRDNVSLGGPGDAMAWLERLGLAAFADRRCGDLPGGVRRKIEVARAMISTPRLLLLDEPAAGLTPGEQDALAETLGALNREGLAVVIIEHEVAFLTKICRRMVCLVEGHIVAQGSPDEVVRDPRVIDAYLGTAR